jgi:hypothetical protein
LFSHAIEGKELPDSCLSYVLTPEEVVTNFTQGDWTFSPIVLPALQSRILVGAHLRVDPIQSLFDYKIFEIFFSSPPRSIKAVFDPKNCTLKLVGISPYDGNHIAPIKVQFVTIEDVERNPRTLAMDASAQVQFHELTSPLSRLRDAIAMENMPLIIETFGVLQASPFVLPNVSWAPITQVLAQKAPDFVNDVLGIIDPAGQRNLFQETELERGQLQEIKRM